MKPKENIKYCPIDHGILIESKFGNKSILRCSNKHCYYIYYKKETKFIDKLLKLFKNEKISKKNN